ncbi:PREDICTED: TD and POZ domain-containing protein 5 isoform X1 [Polistes dominula]|uniref:TD and POZ domain-containing protein 5 isoform X1 n=1 Tax=Polistes dominula TaxID=743375 RepID=A0ABM1HVP2_POLDO|nr:PREDICTED: TD and POZ domain-containing protein 5 isoform X1 [Polistes dominula]
MEKGYTQYFRTEFQQQFQNREYHWRIIDFNQGSIKKSPIFVLPTVTFSVALMYRGNDVVILFLFRRNPYGGYLSVSMKLLSFDEKYIIDKFNREIVYPNMNQIEEDQFVVKFQVTHIYPVTYNLFNTVGSKRQEIIKYINSLYCNIEFHDAVIFFKDTVYPVHKVILASQSIVFEEYFISKERLGEVPLPIQIFDDETENEILVIMLQYIYTNKIEFKDYKDTMNKIITIAATYKVNSLLKLCKDILIENVNIETVFNSILIGDKFNFPDLENYCFQFILTNRTIVTQSKEFAQIKQNPRVLMKLQNFITF